MSICIALSVSKLHSSEEWIARTCRVCPTGRYEHGFLVDPMNVGSSKYLVPPTTDQATTMCGPADEARGAEPGTGPKLQGRGHHVLFSVCCLHGETLAFG